jgi:hypothetical protein
VAADWRGGVAIAISGTPNIGAVASKGNVELESAWEGVIDAMSAVGDRGAAYIGVNVMQSKPDRVVLARRWSQVRHLTQVEPDSVRRELRRAVGERRRLPKTSFWTGFGSGLTKRPQNYPANLPFWVSALVRYLCGAKA